MYLAFLLFPVCCLSLSGLSGLHQKLGSNLPTQGCVSCIGAVAQSICLHQWAGVAVGLGQQDPAKHQLLAAFYTDSHQVGHIYSTASCLVRLEDLSALSAWIFIFSHVASFWLPIILLDFPRLHSQGFLYLLNSSVMPIYIYPHLSYLCRYERMEVSLLSVLNKDTSLWYCSLGILFYLTYLTDVHFQFSPQPLSPLR